eukprot:4529993-Prymnesium_polylepis.1
MRIIAEPTHHSRRLAWLISAAALQFHQVARHDVMIPLCDRSMNAQDQAVIANFSKAFSLVPSSSVGWAVVFNWDRYLSLTPNSRNLRLPTTTIQACFAASWRSAMQWR